MNSDPPSGPSSDSPSEKYREHLRKITEDTHIALAVAAREPSAKNLATFVGKLLGLISFGLDNLDRRLEKLEEAEEARKRKGKNT